MFIYLDRKREKLNQWLKRKTMIDFSDWCVFVLFILGLFSIFHFGQDVDSSNLISVIVLWFTAIAILQYTKETYFLKEITKRQYDLNRTPFVILNYINGSHGGSFRLENIGQGIARNIKIRPIIHQNLKKIIMRDILTLPPITALGSGGGTSFRPVITSAMCRDSGKSQIDLIEEVIEIIKPKFERHLDLEFEILYESATGKPHKTILISSEFEEGYHIKEFE